MKVRFSLFLLIFSFLFTQDKISYAQDANEFRITGTVKDNYNEPLIMATVRINNMKDSLLQGVVTDPDGNFVANNLKPGDYKVIISYTSFEDDIHNVTIKDQNIDLGLIKMQVKQTQLAAVTITDHASAVQQNGDTTSYNANAYKVREGATAGDLISKMPGMDLSSGTPQAQGETVTKVLVDNKPFFGSDAQAALDNLPADVIDRVEVYDEKSDQAKFTGFDDGNTTKTINIVTKTDKRNGVFGKVYAGYGTDETYNAGGNINSFNGDRRLSLIGITNNINVQNFSAQDLVGVSNIGGGRGGSSRGGRGGGSNNFMTGQQAGVSRTNAIGLNYSDTWARKIDVTGSYFFNNSRNIADQDINRLYVLPSQAGQTYQEQDSSIAKNYNHRINLKMDYTIDTNNSILFTPTLSYQKNNSISDMVGQTFQNETESLNQTINSFKSDQNAYNLSGQLLYRHRFSKPGRTLSLNTNGSLNHNKANTILDALNIFTDTTLNSLLDQSGDLKMNTNTVGANLNYTEPVSKNSYIQARYGVNYQHGNSDKFTYNIDPTSEIVLGTDTSLTNVYATNYLTNSAGLAYRVVDKKINATFGLNYQNGRLNSATDLPLEGSIIRHYNNILPYASFQVKFNKTNNLSLFYNTSTQSPSVTQLQGVVNNQNPLQLSSGNPDLNQSYTHNVRIRFRSANADKSLSAFGMLSGTYTQHYIGTNTLVAAHDTVLGNGFALANGGRFTTQENMDGYWNTTAFGGVGMPLYFLKSNLNINANLGYQRLPGIVNNSTNFANNTSAGLGLTLSSNISEKIDFTLTTRGTFNNVKNTVNTQSDNRFYNQLTRLSANYVFWKGFSVGTDVTHQFYTGLSKGFNQSYALWNLNVAKKLFKDQQGEIMVSVYDLLGQNQSIQRTVSEIYSQDVKTNVLTRYFMLTFTYNLRSFYGAQQGNINGRNFGGGNRGMGRF